MRSLSVLLLCGIAAAPLAARAGNRTLQTPTRFITETTTNRRWIFAGDFTGDGKKDVLVGEVGKIHVFAGANDGSFAAAVISDAAGFVPEGLADFNGDARPDLYLIGAGGAGEIAVMFGAANGSFGAPVAVPSSVPAGKLVAGDFTGDGLCDLGLVSSASQQIAIFAGDGNGGFPSSQATALAFSGNVADAAPGDFDDDGHLDIGFITDYHAVVAWNSGTSFTAETIAASPSGFSAGAGDIDGDGIADLVVSSGYGTYVSFGKSARGLDSVKFPATSASGLVTVARVDGDGRADVLSGGAYLTVITHDGDGFRVPRFFGAGDNISGIAAADFTGDGKTDVVALQSDYQGTFGDYFSLIRGNGDGTFAAERVFDFAHSLGNNAWGYTAFLADVNGDAKLDLVAGTSNQNSVAVLAGHGDGTFDDAVLTTLPFAAYRSIYDAGDLNADGRADIILWSPGSTFQTVTVYALFGQPDGTFVAGAAQTGPNGSGTAATLWPVLDYTGDGKRDLLDTAGRILPGLGNGAFGTAIATAINTWPLDVSIADVNGDGRPDLLVPDNTLLTVYLNTGDGTFAAPVQGPAHGLRCTADMNGDGFADLIAGTVSFGDGAGLFTAGSFVTSVTDPCGAVDVDGDGKLDVATSAALYFGAGAGTFDAAAATSGRTENGNGPLLSTADVDGNGSPDLWFFESGRLRIIPTRLGTTGTAPSALAVSTNPNPSVYPSPFFPVATVAAAGIKPRGAVLFTFGAEAPHALNLVGANATASSSHSTVPADTSIVIAANFLGDENYAASSASSNHSVTRGTTKVVLTTSKSTYQLGDGVVMTEMLSSPGGGGPTGTITFRKGDTEIITVNAVPMRTVPIFNESMFPIGTHTLTAEYSGDANYLPTVSAPRTITITKVSPAISLSMPAGPLSDAQQVTLTASFPNRNDVTGSLTFSCFGQTLGTAVIAGSQAAITATLPWGSGKCIAQYSGNDKYGPSSQSMPATVYHGAMPLAPLISASPSSLGAHWVSVAISPISGAASYDIYRGVDGSPLTLWTNTTIPTYSDFVNPTTATVAVYAAVARSGTGATTAMGPRDLVTFVTFTDDPLIASTTTVKAVHITELQTAINAVRLAAGLTATIFATPSGTISAAHLTSMRQALTQARGALGLATSITDGTITPGVTRVRAIHLQELRDAVK
jgi:hypothetical protein